MIKKLIQDKLQYRKKYYLKWCIIYGLVATLMFFFTMVENRLYADGNIIWTPGYAFTTLLKSAGLGLPTGIVLNILSEIFAEIISRTVNTDIKKKNKSGHSSVIGLLSFLLITASRIPAFLAYYPGICTYDTAAQLTQTMENSYTEHHPVIHTLLIKASISIGNSFGYDATASISIYFILQIIITSAAIAYAVAVTYEMLKYRYCLNAKLVYIITGCITICMMFFPYNQYMALSLTKDSIFSSFILIMLVSLWHISDTGENVLTPKSKDWIYFTGAAGAIIFRNNAKYALLATIAVLVIAVIVKRQKWMLRVLIVSITALLSGSIILVASSKAINAAPGSKVEMLSIPIQQFSRAMLYHGGVGILEEDDNTISDKDKELINDFILNGSYIYYHPNLSDPVKQNTNFSVLVNKKGTFVRTYFRLLKDYPNEMVNAVLALDAGFISLSDESSAHICDRFNFKNHGYVQTFWNDECLNANGIYKQSKLPGLFEYMENWAENNSYLDIPLIRYIFMPGIYFWIIIFTTLHYFKKNKKFLFSSCFILFYYITMIFGPTVTMRYVYPIMLITPFMFCMTLHTGKKDNTENNTTDNTVNSTTDNTADTNKSESAASK